MAPFLVRLCNWSVDFVYTSLFNDMDGVKTVLQPESDTIPELKSSRRIINRRYLFPCLLYSFYLIDTLHLLLFSHSQWSFSGNATSDGTIGRKWLPPSVAQHADVFFLEAVLMLFGIAALFLVHNMETFEEQFRMVAMLDEDGNLKEIKQKGQVEAEAILKLHKKLKTLSNCLSLIITLFAYPFYNACILLNWRSSLADVKALVLMNLMLPYVIMHLFVSICCFVFNCRYLRLRQKTHLARFQGLIARSNQTLGQLTKRKARPGVSFLGLFTWSSWAHFKAINGHLNDLSLQINGFNAFWSRYLTVYFAGLTFLVTYMAFLSLKLAGTQSMFATAFLAFLAYFAFVLFGLLLWITLECSVLVVNNKETLKLQRIFKVHTSLAGRIPLPAAIKFDHIEADSQSIGRIGFNLLDSVQINSQMFELLFFYISSLFMKIVQHDL